MADNDLSISERDRDLMIRTLYGEANGQPPRGQAAVAHVILNRMMAPGYPDNVAGVVLQRGQFEPWGSRRGELLSLSPNSRGYQEAAQTVRDVLAGEVPDPTNGATHFFAPYAQAALGRRPPSWAKDPLARIGGHVFFAPNGPVTIAPPEPGVPATLDEAGIAPRGASPSTSKASPTMPKPATKADTSDDDLLALYGVGPAGKPEAAPKPAASPTMAPAAPKASGSTAAPGGLSDDALLGLYMAPPSADAAKPGKAPGQSAASAPPLPLPTADDIVDGNTGALVVGGKPFTDNRDGLWSGFRNLANGALLGAGVPISAAAAAVREKLTNGGDLASLYAQARSAYGGAQDQYRQQNPGTALATELAGSLPTTIGATMAGGAALGMGGNALLDAVAGSRAAAPLAAAGQFITGGAGQGGSVLARIGSQAVAGAGAGALGGAINTGLTGGDVAGNAVLGAVTGGVIGGALPAAGAAARGVVNRLTGRVEPEVAALARMAQDTYGIPIRAGQMTDSPSVRFLDSTLSRTPGMGYGAANRTQQTAINKAVAATFGETADRITPGVLQAARDRLGKSFDKVAQGSTVRADNQLAGDLADVFQDAGSVLVPAELTPLRNLVKDGILPKFGTSGDMAGDAYQALTRKDAPLGRLQSSTNPNVRYFAGRVRDALDGALERSAPADLVAELRQTRSQYRAMKTIEDLAAKSTTGDISPALLMQAVQKNGGSAVAYQGGGALGDLARIGQRFLKEPPSSGTAERLAAADRLGQLAKVGQMVGGAAGAAVGINHFAPQIAAAAPSVLGPALASTAASYGAGRVASQVLRSPALANRLIDQALGTSRAGPINRLASAIGDLAPETTAPLALRVIPQGSGANDNSPAGRLADFLANRHARPGGMLP